MGRRKKIKIGYFDRLGERIPLNKCPRCSDYPDCFANIDGICTALKCCSQGCSFYKEKESAMQIVNGKDFPLRREYDSVRRYFLQLKARYESPRKKGNLFDRLKH